MVSLFGKRRTASAQVVTLPTSCIPTIESGNLAAKRDARLKWMRENGMAYLGDPLDGMKKDPPPRLSVVRMRVVTARNDASDDGALALGG